MEDITVSELKERLDKGEKFAFVDVREPWEYDEDNLGAMNIPLSEVPTRMSELADLKDTELVVHCRSGARSGNAKAFLSQNGFNKVRNVLGGILAYRELESQG